MEKITPTVLILLLLIPVGLAKAQECLSADGMGYTCSGGSSAGGGFGAGAGVGAGAAGAVVDQMLQDPEDNISDSGLDVTADSAAAARRKCEDTATARSVGGAIVTCLGCNRRTRSGKWMCTLRTEG
jgi:hypothetical protein